MNIKYVILVFLLTVSNVCMAQNHIFDKYADVDDVTTVYISKKMFQLMPSMANTGLELENMKNKIDALQILTTENKERADMLKKSFSTIIKKEHEELMRIKENDTHTTFHILQEGTIIKELIMLVIEPNEFTVIYLSGNFTIDDIQEITKNKK